MKDLFELLYDTTKEFGASRAYGPDMKNMESFRPKCCEFISEGDITILSLRDALITAGNILEEDLETNTYKAVIHLGNSNLKTALAVARIEEGKAHVCTYAKEGLINQHMAKKAITKLKTLLE